MERDRIFSHFGRFFGLLPPKKTENQNFEKKTNKKPGYHFTQLHLK